MTGKRQFVRVWVDDLARPDVSPAAKLVAAYVSYRVYGGQAREVPTTDVATACGLSRSRAGRALAEAVEHGLISCDRSSRPGGANVYREAPADEADPSHQRDPRIPLAGSYDPRSGILGSQERDDPSHQRDPRIPLAGRTHPASGTTHPASGIARPPSRAIKSTQSMQAEQAESGPARSPGGSTPPGGAAPRTPRAGAQPPAPPESREPSPPKLISTGWSECPVIPIPAADWEALLGACGLSAGDPEAWSVPIESFLIDRRRKGRVNNWSALIARMIADGDLSEKGIDIACQARKGSGRGPKLKVVDPSLFD